MSDQCAILEIPTDNVGYGSHSNQWLEFFHSRPEFNSLIMQFVNRQLVCLLSDENLPLKDSMLSYPNYFSFILFKRGSVAKWFRALVL